MASRPKRSYRTKYTKNTHEHIIFVAVVLLAAIVYAHHIKSPVGKQPVLDIGAVVLALVIVALVITLLRKLAFTARTRRFRNFQVNSMKGVEFERYVADLLQRQGYKHVRLTSYYDFGCDIVAEKDGIRWGIQVKRYSVPVGKSAVEQAVTGLKPYDCDRAMVITNNSFTPRAHSLAKGNNCVLVDGQQLIRWASS